MPAWVEPPAQPDRWIALSNREISPGDRQARKPYRRDLPIGTEFVCAVISLQRAEVLRNVDGVPLQHGQIDHLERSSVGGGEYHRWSRPGLMSLKPTLRNHAPAITGLQTWKAVFGDWSDQVIPDTPLVLEEFRCYHGAHQMDCTIWSGAAAPIAIEACDRLRTAGLQFAAEDIAFTLHNTSLA
jgi:hypothetical protein